MIFGVDFVNFDYEVSKYVVSKWNQGNHLKLSKLLPDDLFNMLNWFWYDAPNQ